MIVVQSNCADARAAEPGLRSLRPDLGAGPRGHPARGGRPDLAGAARGGDVLPDDAAPGVRRGRDVAVLLPDQPGDGRALRGHPGLRLARVPAQRDLRRRGQRDHRAGWPGGPDRGRGRVPAHRQRVDPRDPGRTARAAGGRRPVPHRRAARAGAGGQAGARPAARRPDRADPGRGHAGGHAGRRADRRAVHAAGAEGVRGGTAAAAVRRSSRGGGTLLRRHRHLPHHARGGAAARGVRAAAVAGPVAAGGLRAGQAGGGGAAGGDRGGRLAAALGLRRRGADPERDGDRLLDLRPGREHRDAAHVRPVLLRAGPDQAAASGGGTVRGGDPRGVRDLIGLLRAAWVTGVRLGLLGCGLGYWGAASMPAARSRAVFRSSRAA